MKSAKAFALQCGLVFWISAMLINDANARPVIERISNNGSVVTIRGAGFGQQCAGCEVVSDYGGFRYALPVVRWTNRLIDAKLVDIGKSLTPVLQIHTPDGKTVPRKVRVKVQQLPTTKERRMIPTGAGKSRNGLLVFERKHDLSIGGKGDAVFEFNQSPPRCGQSGSVFDSAELVFGKRTRFGDAKIIGGPAADCHRCKIKVGYYWEPTGRLEYQLHVYRRHVEGICRDRIR